MIIPSDIYDADEMERRQFAHFKSLGDDLTARTWQGGFNPVHAFATKGDPKK